MTSSGGMKIGLKATSALLDTVFGLKDGSVRQQSHSDLGTQLMSSGPLANLLATTSGNVVFFATKETMDLAVDYSAPQAAWVFADDDPANNGAYYFTNGDPGFWTFMLNFPNSWVYATVSGGDANAIELSMPATVSPSTMIFFEVQDDNLAGGVTVSINGGIPMDLLDFRGDALEASALGEGALAVFFPLGDGTARMVIDNTATAAAAAAAASAASANASALASSDSALAAAGSATSAQRFADAPEDEETSPGSGLYSAFHWAQKAMSVVLGDLADQITAAVAATPAAADLFAFVENVSGDLKKISFSNLIAALKSDGDVATKTGVETLTNKTLDAPVLTNPLSQATAETGTDNTKPMTALRTRQSVDASVIGRGQTWQLLTGSRSIGVTYTNTTGKPIMVGVSFQTGAIITLKVDTIASGQISGGGADLVTVYAIVPPGSAYLIQSSAGGSINTWSELR